MLHRFIRLCKVALSSNGLFRNWFSASLKYFLASRKLTSLRNIVVKCRDGAEASIPYTIYSSIINAYYEKVIEEFSCKDRKVITKRFTIPLRELETSDAIVDALKRGWEYDETCGAWVKDGARFKHMRYTILEVFGYEEYKYADVCCRDVVDIGAAYGDSAVYFALKGAKKVIAIEPCSSVYREMIENLKLNGVGNRVTPINAALSSTSGSSCIECSGEKITLSTITLGDVVEKFNIQEGVLKMDCEGCEYDIILNDYEHVKVFNEVYFEYHAYATGLSIDVLLKRLSKDYKCKIVSDEEFYRRHGYNEKFLGLVKCVKVY
jgi:FkbM family methyltransferase